jgi:hypothetical protein
MNLRRFTIVFLLGPLISALFISGASAENYVNWKGGFWFEIPDGWEKVDYMVVDRQLRRLDTSSTIYDYEAVFAPSSSENFTDDAYLVIRFDSTGELTRRQSDSILNEITGSFNTQVYDAPIVKMMSDLIPGQPQVNRADRVASILIDMAYRPGEFKKLWQYMQLNNRGLISLYFYSLDSTFKANKTAFESIITSLSFENLREAAKGEFRFTDIGGDNVGEPQAGSGDQISQQEKDQGSEDSGLPFYYYYSAIFMLILILIIRRLRRKKLSENRPEMKG